MLDVLGIKNYAKLVPMDDDIRPRDPVTENQNILKGKPVKAFMYQDHQAHITVHMTVMQDPHVQQLMAQDPNAQALQATMQAHINEHLGYEYRKQIEQVMGFQIPTTDEVDNDDQVIPKDMEIMISQKAAQASQQILQQHKQEAQMQQAQQQMQDPVVQMQMQELQLKAQELQRKAAKDQADNAARMAQIEVEKERIDAQKEIAGANMAMRHATDMNKAERQQESEGFKAGITMMQKRHESNRPQPRPPTKKGE
jgi:hypothetical protein